MEIEPAVLIVPAVEIELITCYTAGSLSTAGSIYTVSSVSTLSIVLYPLKLIEVIKIKISQLFQKSCYFFLLDLADLAYW